MQCQPANFVLHIRVDLNLGILKKRLWFCLGLTFPEWKVQFGTMCCGTMWIRELILTAHGTALNPVTELGFAGHSAFKYQFDLAQRKLVWECGRERQWTRLKDAKRTLAFQLCSWRFTFAGRDEWAEWLARSTMSHPWRLRRIHAAIKTCKKDATNYKLLFLFGPILWGSHQKMLFLLEGFDETYFESWSVWCISQ